MLKFRKKLYFCVAAFTTCILPGELTQALEPQIISPNAYKVPYLGIDGTFNLNQEDKTGFSDPRSPKRITAQKMEKFTFYRDVEGKQAIAQNCTYAYMGAAPDPKYYAQYKLAVWDLFELMEDDKQDKNCQQFKYLSIAAPHEEAGHMHLRYGDTRSSFQTILNISNDAKPWTPTYCTSGKIRCGEE